MPVGPAAEAPLPGGLRLPAHAHRPGTGTTPDVSPLEAAKALTPARVVDADWRAVAPYLLGHHLHRAGFAWEAHEVWEAVWLATPPNGLERLVLRALIQMANAALKHALDRPAAARRLAREADGLLAEVERRARGPALVMGIDPARTRASLGRWIDRAQLRVSRR